jgi:hypothetical protein
VNESLLGTHIEVLTEIELAHTDEKGDVVLDDEGNEMMVYSKQWLPAEVMRFAEADDKKKSKSGSTIKVKPGCVLLDYDDGVSIWTRLRQEQFNCKAVGSWRLDLDEIVGHAGNDEAEKFDDGEMSDESGGTATSSEDEEHGGEDDDSAEPSDSGFSGDSEDDA